MICFSNVSWGQGQGTYSPYSRYGVGERALYGYSHSVGMAGVSVGLRSPNAINALNPASYTRQDTMSFIFDLGVNVGYYIARASDGQQLKNSISRINYIAIQVPLHKWGGIAFGYQPYSIVGYTINRYESRSEILSRFGNVRYNHRGSGGLSEAYLGIAVKPFSSISIGLNVRYLFGSINRQQDLFIPSSSIYANVYTYTRAVYRGGVLTPGVQYHVDFGNEKKRSFVFGATLDITPFMSKSIYYDIKQNVLGREVKIADNIRRSRSNTPFPLRYAMGFFYKDKSWGIGSDFAMQNWKGHTLGNGVTELGSTEMLIALGGSWTPNAMDLRNYAKRIEYKAGFRYIQLPVRVDGRSIQDLSLHLGCSLPFRFTPSRIHVAAQFGHRGERIGRLVEEMYIRLHLGVSLNDVWFLKYKYN